MPRENLRKTGSQMEEAAVSYLAERGVTILERNFRDRNGEIDLIAQEDGVLLFIEVKYRRSSRYGEPEEAVNVEKQRKISRTALYYLHHKQEGMQTPMRFDVISVTDGEIRWIRDAFPFTD